MHNHYCTRKEDMFQERTVTTDALLDVPIDALLIEYAGFKNYVAQQKWALSEEYTAKEKSQKAKYLLVDSQKYETRKQGKAIEEELKLTTKRKSNPFSVKDLLWDNMAETAFPNVCRLMKIYVLILMSEAIVEKNFLRWEKLWQKNALL